MRSAVPSPYDADTIRQALQAARDGAAQTHGRAERAALWHTFSEAELAAWQGLGFTRRELVAHFAGTLSESRFILSAEGQEVRIWEKPQVFPHPHAADLNKRAALYAEFLGTVLRERNLRLSFVLLLDAHDMIAPQAAVPTFNYQKITGANSISFPDIEFLGTGYYRDPGLIDLKPYAEKRATAAFIGSTSGYPYVLTRAHVEAEASPRLGSAAFFRDHDEVDFRVTNIVQTDGPETDALIRARGLISTPLPFQSLYDHRFIISMDGNGATCSRVALALASRSVLLKYHSDYGLYYFPALVPWLHYVPIHRDEDVLAVVRYERAHPGAFAPVAEAGAHFYRATLTRERLLDYGAALISGYAALFNALPEG